MTAQSPSSPAPPSAPPTRSFMAAGFVMATIITTGLTSIGALMVSQYQTDRAEKIQQISAFVKSTQDFDPLVTSYVIALDGGKDTKSKATLLESNIQQQHILLGAAKVYLSGDALREADGYRETLVNISDALDKTTSPLAGHAFAQSTADAAAERERVIADLRRSAGLSAPPSPRRTK